MKMSSSVFRSGMISSLLKPGNFRRLYCSESSAVAGAPQKEQTQLTVGQTSRTVRQMWNFLSVVSAGLAYYSIRRMMKDRQNIRIIRLATEHEKPEILVAYARASVHKWRNKL